MTAPTSNAPHAHVSSPSTLFRSYAAMLRAVPLAAALVFDPTRVDRVLALASVAARHPGATRVLEELRGDPTLHGRLRERVSLGPVELERLAALPAGTLGHEYASFMRTHDLSTETLVLTHADTELGYLADHVRESHDLWHVLSGFDTDVAGELGVQAFYVAQLRVPFGMLVLALGLLNALLASADEREVRMEAIVRGFLLGKRARPLFGLRWSELWAEPLEKLRQELRIDLAGVERVLSASASGSNAEVGLRTKPCPVDVELAHASA